MGLNRTMLHGLGGILGQLTLGEFVGTLGIVRLTVVGCLVSRCPMVSVGIRFLMIQLLILVAR